MSGKPPAEPTPIAYSYIRFSSPRQAEGDSLRRQTEAAADWCKRHKVRLDMATTLHDLGRSAFTGKHRENPDRNALASFLKLVETGRVPRGSVLIVESLDRLTREHIRPALTLLLNLIEAGVRIVQLKPVEAEYGEHVEPMALMMAIMELSRGHSESAVKSGRCREAWAEKKNAARQNGTVLTENTPRWIEAKVGKLRLIPERAEIVKRIFRMAAEGYGLVATAKKLTGEGIPSFGGRRQEWTRSYLALILKDRRALGEHQPMKDGKKDGDVIPDYYPAAVTEAEWLAARAGRSERRKKPGRVSADHVNVFAGLLRSALDGGPYHLDSWKVRSGRRTLALVNFRATEGLTRFRSFPYESFEAAVLHALKELDPREVLGTNGGVDEVSALAAEMAGLEGELADAVAFMEANGFSPAIGKRVTDLEAKKKELGPRLADARARAEHPAAQSWGEAQTLAGLVATAADPNEVRLKLRSALRRIVDTIWLLVVASGADRLVAVQIWFAGGKRHRDYLILHRPPKVNGAACTEGGWRVLSLASVAKPGDLDLRKPAQARKLEALLAGVDLETLQGAMGAGEV